jgi:hypothetical protein
MHIKKRLKVILDNSKINHKREIMNSKCLKDAHIYCKINNLSGQIAGPLIEYYIKNKYDMKKNNASSCTGDLEYKENNIEIKISNGGKEHNKFNYVQIRMNHDCYYILTAYYIAEYNIDAMGELFIFKLSKDDIKDIIIKYGGYAHGTKNKLGKITKEDLDNVTNDKEYAIRTKYGDKCWKELLRFRIDEIIV